MTIPPRRPGRSSARNGAADEPLLAVVRELDEAGYDAQFIAASDARLLCTTCRGHVPADRVDVDGMRRLEGASDPADNLVVFNLACPSCGTNGTFVAHYGPQAGPAEEAVLRALPSAGLGT